MVFVPLVLSEFTVTVPLYVVTAVGLKDTVNACDPPDGIVPLHVPGKHDVRVSDATNC